MSLAPVSTLGLAILGLLLGPTLASAAPRRAAWRDLVDGLSVALVGGLCVLHLAPHALEHGGLWAALALVVGAGLPVLLHRLPEGTGWAWPALGLGLLAVHSATDGAVLAHDDHGVGASLTLAVVAHRLPVGMAVFEAVRRASLPGGVWAAWGAIAVLVAATLVGFVSGEALTSQFSETAHGAFEALVTGALLHTVLAPHSHGHHHAHGHDGHHGDDHGHDAHHDGHGHGHGDHHDHGGHGHEHGDHGHGHGHGHHGHGHGDHGHAHREHGHAHGDHGHGHHHHGDGRPPLWGAVGAVVGLLVVVGFSLSADDHGALHHMEETAQTFVALALDSAPALLAGFVLAGVIGATLNLGSGSWLASGPRPVEALRGVVFGLPLPVCSCGVVPMYDSLVRRGVPVATAMAFLVATPELGLDAVLLSVPLLGWPLTIARVVAAFLAALLVALLVGSAPVRVPTRQAAAHGHQTPFAQRLVEGLRYSLVDLVDHTMPWVLVGLVAAALAEPLLDHGLLLGLPAAVQVPLASLIGVPLYVCASGATPLAAMAVHKGLSSGAAIAFLIAGPATNITTFGLLTALHGRQTALRFGVALVGFAVLAGWAVDLAQLPTPDLFHGGDSASPSARPVAWACAAILTTLVVGSLFRQGPRGLVDQLTHPIHAH